MKLPERKSEQGIYLQIAVVALIVIFLVAFVVSNATRVKLRGGPPGTCVGSVGGDGSDGAALTATVGALLGVADAVADGGPPEHAARSSALSASPRIAVTSSGWVPRWLATGRRRDI